MHNGLVKIAFQLGYKNGLKKQAQAAKKVDPATYAATLISKYNLDVNNPKDQEYLRKMVDIYTGKVGKNQTNWGAFGSGVLDGLVNDLNTATFGLTDRVGLTDAKGRMSQYSPGIQAATNFAAENARDAAIAALTGGMLGKTKLLKPVIYGSKKLKGARKAVDMGLRAHALMSAVHDTGNILGGPKQTPTGEYKDRHWLGNAARIVRALTTIPLTSKPGVSLLKPLVRYAVGSSFADEADRLTDRRRAHQQIYGDMAQHPENYPVDARVAKNKEWADYEAKTKQNSRRLKNTIVPMTLATRGIAHPIKNFLPNTLRTATGGMSVGLQPLYEALMGSAGPVSEDPNLQPSK